MSVLIGCWNAAGTLGEAIDSILSQSVRDLELIVVDDGSTDSTPELVAEAVARDRRVRYLPLAHQGISASLNRGLEHARAGLVALQDDDDRSLPDRLALQLAVMEHRPEVVWVGSRMCEVDGLGRRLIPRTTFRAGDVNAVLLRFNPAPNTCSMLRRDLTLEIGGFDPRWRYAMDYDLLLRLAERGVVHNLNDELVIRRMDGTNVSARHEREQTLEAIRIRRSAIRRRGSNPADYLSLAVPVLALLTPMPLKRLRRRRLGQAP